MVKLKKHGSVFAVALLLSTQIVKAHCPLCTIGAATAAGGAAYLGVSNTVIGIFIGAFAVSIGWWFARIIKKQFVPYQKPAIIILSFLTTVIPMMPLLSDIHGLYIPWIGAYGSTLAIDLFIVGALLGGFITSITPWLSKKITALRNGKMIPYQGILLTVCLLLISGVIIQIAS
jgi:hypothetical protein